MLRMTVGGVGVFYGGGGGCEGCLPQNGNICGFSYCPWIRTNLIVQISVVQRVQGGKISWTD